jgi:hypothetical protein
MMSRAIDEAVDEAIAALHIVGVCPRIFLGTFLGTFLGVLLSYFLYTSRTVNERSMRSMQRIGVIATLESLYWKVRCQACDVAWRNALPPTADYVGSVIQKEDTKMWKDFNVALHNLRANQIKTKTQCFEANSIELQLFSEIDDTLNAIADKLFMIYHSNEVGNSKMLPGQKRPCLEIPEKGFTEKDRLEIQEEFLVLLDLTRRRISSLAEMILFDPTQKLRTVTGMAPTAKLDPDQERELHLHTLAQKQVELLLCSSTCSNHPRKPS